ncbi:TGN-related, localized SYP41 interacting protein [Parasponia andersonii]|uniref:TGN-related, localized SYP41 interacting protein n=1 Tax=Parasponia andersonii TaxID=3476 RepID=A0A2P5B0L7_PARAD|nr:TGN-related, localized SYP41 interacting protein [Parasponia andersonii]
MSESDKLDEGSAAMGEEGQPFSSSELSLDRSIESESSKVGIQSGVGRADNQEFGSVAAVADHNGVLEVAEGDEDDPKVIEDSGKEDMFVDCPDELVTGGDGKEAVAVFELEDNLEPKLHLSEANGTKDEFAADELERLRAVHDKIVREKESVSLEFKEEREAFARELASLRNQLKGITNGEPLSLIGEGGSQESEDGTRELDTNVPVNELVNECVGIVKHACEERLQSKATIRDLQAALLTKNQEIEELNTKLSEFPLSHIETVTDRLLSYLTGIVDPQKALDCSIGGKLVSIENGTYTLAVTYNMLLSEIDQLRQCLSGTRLDGGLQDFGSIFAAVRDELLELKRKELDFVEQLNHLEYENRKLVQQLDEQRMMVERVNAELGKTKTELEQEKTRCSNTKEKLTMAVTKGKALVQQRDSLKQTLAEKTSELEKCLVELQEKSSALEAAELHKEELLRRENAASSLQETLFQKNVVLEKFEEILSQSGIPEELLLVDIVERCRWLVDENIKLKGFSLEFHKVKDALSLIHLPETVSSSELDSQVHWVRESLYQAKTELKTMQDEIAMTREAAEKEIDRLSASLLAELQTKDYLQVELDDLTCKYKDIVEKEQQLSVEKDLIVKMLLEASGTTRDVEGVCHSSADFVTVVERCFRKLKEQTSASLSSSYVDTELFEKVQSYLYVRNQELVLCELLLEEEMLMRSEASNLSNELRMVSQELVAVKEENESLQKDLQRSEEKSSLLREKLSMAVKKGKGLVQDRENLKLQLGEKYSEIEKLRLQCQQQESDLAEHREQINSLSAEIEGIAKLEMDLAAMNEERNQLEKFLLESNNLLQRVIESIEGIVIPVDSDFDEPVEKVNWLGRYISECQVAKVLAEKEMVKVREEVVTLAGKLVEAEATIKSLESNNLLQRVIESIDGIILPVDSVFDEPVEKVNWLAGYVDECQDAKALAEKEFVRVKEEVSTLAGKLVEAEATIKSLEDTLSVAENNISRLAEEKREIEVTKDKVEQGLQKAQEEASLHASKITDVFESKKSLEEALALAENNIHAIISEKESALLSRIAAETELEQVKEEVVVQTSKLTEAFKTMKSLEDALSQAQTNVTLLTEQNNDAQVHRTNLENELKKLQEEAVSEASKLAGAFIIIKSLEEALLRAENNVSVLDGEKKSAEGEILTLNSKLNICMEELAGTNGGLENRSVELSGYLHDLQVLMNDNTLLSIMKGFEEKFDSLKNMDIILEHIRDRFVGLGFEETQRHHVTEENLHVTNSIADGPDNISSLKKDNGDGEVSVVDGDLISSFSKTLEGLQLRDKILAEKFAHFSSFLDEFVATLLRKLEVTKGEVVVVFEHIESLKQKVNSLETHKQEQENAIASLEKDVTTLLSACTDATRELQFEVKNNLLAISSLTDVEKLRHSFLQGIGEIGVVPVQEGHLNIEGSKYGKDAEMLLLATRKVQALCKHFESTTDVAASTIIDLQNDLKKARTTSEKAIEESDLKRNTISTLEADVEALETSCSELRLIIEDYQAKQVKLEEKDAEVLSLRNSLSMKEREAEDTLLSASQVKTLFDKIREIEIPVVGYEVGDIEPQNSTQVKKLFYIIDNVIDLQHQINSISDEKENLQSTLASQMLEIHQLKEEIDKYITDEQATERMKFELSELIFGLEKIIGILGGDALVGDQNSSGVKGPLAVLENQAMALLLEYESSKSKAQDLGIKLVQNQNIVDELLTKVKFLEDSLQGRGTQPEIIQERSIYEGPSLPAGPEISEIEDLGSLGKKTISPVPSAAHVRTMRKGSTDHLALDIDVESNRLINNEETDEDKGHVFKSLNTSGLVPRQGKLIADRIDGIWVSGGRVLMSRPRARLGVIAYCLLLHMWLLGAIL